MEGVEEEDPLLGIGAFARRSRLSQKALRLYDGQGVLRPDRVDPATGYRYYRESRLADARRIRLLRGLDMPLAAVAEVLAAPGPQAAALVAEYWEQVERRTAAQRELAAYLRIQLTGGEGILDMFDIQQREVPEQLVLTEQRHIRPEELPEWIPAACDRLFAVAQAHGGVFGAPFVVYHGEVNDDSDGPVELCVPVDPARAGGFGAPSRTEPAHREAYTTVTKAQVVYPQILSAYDAVFQWAKEHDETVSAGPREVYFVKWDEVAPGDPACDIAVPIG
ncbi:MerR family transcriptional regulator [Kitasatospora sp. MBT63]|uniref:MerR family transcriptional regulator n=1 Tax=Kitasatospora sp. MBT63 TaxID=1444768 RepID=UPI00053AFDF8|nr:MerR family transcriptional regulator [Kitasatospora sp. MBT63]